VSHYKGAWTELLCHAVWFAITLVIRYAVTFSYYVLHIARFQIDKLEVVNKKWVRLKFTPGSQVESVCIIIFYCLYQLTQFHLKNGC